MNAAVARLCLPPADWPPEDQRCWDEALQVQNPFDDPPGGTRADFRDISNRKVEKGYGRWIGWLTRRGQLDPTQASGDRITREAVVAYLRDLHQSGNAGSTLTNRLQELHAAATVMAPERDWRWIRRLAAAVRCQHGLRRKRDDVHVPDSAELLELGAALITSAVLEPTARKAATQYRDGLVIAFLALCPLRLADLIALQLGTHLRRQGSGTWRLMVTQSKTGEDIDVPWPPPLVPALEAYLATHRLVLAACRPKRGALPPAGDALWVSGDGAMLGHGRLHASIAGRTAAAFGKRVSPHRFRHAAATSIAENAPVHVYIVKAVLGHRGITTGGRYYNLAKSTAAVERFQETIQALRDGALGFAGYDGSGDGQDAILPAPAGGTASLWATVPGRQGDPTGQVLGRLTVLGLADRTAKGRPRWRVRCTDCGTKDILRHDALLAINPPATTGCDLCDRLDRLKQEFLIGKAIGGGSVIAYVGRSRHGYHTWLCRCQCSAESVRETGNLQNAIAAGRIACRRCAHLGVVEPIAGPVGIHPVGGS